MSNFNCEHCGAPCLDSPQGYTTGCEHYPPDVLKEAKVKREDCEHCGGKGGRWDNESIDQFYWCEHCDAGEKHYAKIRESKAKMQQVPKIKPLVWERGNELINEWTAVTPFGKFRVFRRPEDDVARIYLSPIQHIKHPHIESVEETKAYCEAEYERCVKECMG